MRLLLILFVLSTSVQLQPVQGDAFAYRNRGPSSGGDRPLRVSGVASEVQLSATEHTRHVEMTLTLTATNISNRPLILLRQTPEANAEVLYRSSVDKHELYSSSHFASVYRGSPDRKWEKLQDALDKDGPPEDLTIILGPGASLQWKIPVALNISRKAQSISSNEPWNVIRGLSPVWLEVTLEVWPVNVEPTAGANGFPFGQALAERWEPHGRLLLERVQTDRIELDFDAATETGRP